MGRIFAWLGLGLAVFIVALALRTPAAWVHDWFGDRLPPELTLHGLEGSILAGSGQARWRDLVLERVEWDFAPSGLLAGRLEYAVDAAGPAGELDGRVGLRWDGAVSVRELFGSLRVAPLSDALLPLPLGLEGSLEPAFSELILDRGWPIAAEGGLILSGLALGGQSVGAVQARVSQTAGPVALDLGDDGSGALRLAGTLTLDPQRAYRLQGSAASDVPAMGTLLALVGQRRSDGAYDLELSGALE